jgi:hypothetical protein
MTRKKTRVPSELPKGAEKLSPSTSPKSPAYEAVREAVRDVFVKREGEDEEYYMPEPLRVRFIPDTFDRSQIREVLIGKEIMLPDGFVVAVQGVPNPRLPMLKK